jgi:predicted transposase/invertase (TIGR01784 family)
MEGGGRIRMELTRKKAMEDAVKWCIANNILRDFFENHGSEVVNMLLTEWNLEDALEVEREEGREEGLEEAARNALAKGLPLDMIGEITGLDMETIKSFAGQ